MVSVAPSFMHWLHIFRKTGPWTRLTYLMEIGCFCRIFIKTPKRLFTVLEIVYTHIYRWMMANERVTYTVHSALDISGFSIWKSHLKQFFVCNISVNAIRFENEYKMNFQPLLHWWKIHRQSSTLLITESICYLCFSKKKKQSPSPDINLQQWNIEIKHTTNK